MTDTRNGKPSLKTSEERSRQRRRGAAVATETDPDEQRALLAGKQPDRVELGSISDVDDGENLALRHFAERGTHGGLPTMDDAGSEAASGPVTDQQTRVQRVIAEFKSYGEIRRTPYGMGPALILGFITFFQIIDTAVFRFAGPDIVRDLGIPINDLIDISRLIGTIGIFASIYMGWFADRHKRTPFIWIGTLGSAIGAALTTRANSFAGLGWGRVTDDVSNLGADVVSFSLLADYYPPEARGRVFAFLGNLNRAGSLMAIILSGVLIDRVGWRTTGFIFAIPIAVMALIAALRLREPVRGYMERRALGADDDDARVEDEPKSFAEGWRIVWGVRTLRRIFVAQAIGSGAVGFAFYYTFFLAEKYGLSASGRAFVTLPSLFTGLAGGFYGGAIIDRFTRSNPGRVLTVYGMFSAIAALGAMGYAFGPPLFFVILAQMIFAFGFAMTGPALSVVYAQVVPSSVRTQGLQMTGLAALPGLVVFAPIAQVVFGNGRYTQVFLLDIPWLLVSALLVASAGSFFDLDARSAFAATLADQEWRRAKASGKGKLLVCRDIDVEYSGVQVLFGVDFDVEEGEIVALLGTNGAGKSTLLRAISGMTQAAGGAVIFDGRDITRMPPNETAERGVIFMPGGRGVFPGLTVRENLIMANWMADDPDGIRERLTETLAIFPSLNERLDANAGDLSGGEQQQLSLAQAFLTKPRLLMIDELSLGLSPAVVGQLLEIVREIHARGVTIIVVEQSVNVALTLAERAIFMEKGEVKFNGKTSDLLARPDILRAVYVKGTGALTSGAPAGARRSERRQRELELAEAQPILQVREVVKHYGGVTAVNGVTFDLRDGEVLGLIGPNGAGKTTVLELISGFQEPDEGRIGYQGVDITSLKPEERAQQGLIRRFQNARMFPALTVYETLLVALELQLEVRSTFLHAAGMPQARRAEKRLRVRADRLIELLDLSRYQDKFVRELSTGLRRIVDLACVLATEPKVLLLDEPSAGIAQAEAEGLAPMLRRVRFETGCSILMIEHDMPLISAVSDELIAFDRGELVLRGRPEAVLNDERVIEAYLGTSEAAINRSGRNS
ncbi:MAG: MFS transporter [Acidimicrobiales bacterium]